MSSTSVPFSPKTKELIKEWNQHHRDPKKKIGILDPTIELYSTTGLGIKGKDAESRIETNSLPGGEVQVSFIYVLDNNGSSQDGRIYLRDEFILEGNRQGLKTYQRNFHYNGKGSSEKEWKKWLGLYQGLEIPSLMGRVEFSHALARHQGIPLKTQKAFVPSLGKAGKDYLVSVARDIQAVAPKATLKIYDPQSYYSVVRQGNQIEITLSMAVDRDSDPKNGRVFFRETYLLDARSHRLLQNVQRHWDVAYESRHISQMHPFVEKMEERPPPSLKEVQTYAQTWIPLLLQAQTKPPVPKVKKVQPKAPSTKNLPPPQERPTPPRSAAIPHSGVSESGGNYSFSFAPKPKGDRSVSMDRVKWKAGKLALPHYKMATHKRAFPLRVHAILEIDNQTGNLQKIHFANVDTGRETLSQDKVRILLKRMAGEIYRGLSLAKQVGRKKVIVKTEFKFLPAN